MFRWIFFSFVIYPKRITSEAEYSPTQSCYKSDISAVTPSFCQIHRKRESAVERTDSGTAMHEGWNTNTCINT